MPASLIVVMCFPHACTGVTWAHSLVCMDIQPEGRDCLAACSELAFRGLACQRLGAHPCYTRLKYSEGSWKDAGH